LPQRLNVAIGNNNSYVPPLNFRDKLIESSTTGDGDNLLGKQRLAAAPQILLMFIFYILCDATA
jgi:hypothetical protein